MEQPEPMMATSMSAIPLAVPQLHDTEWEYVRECLATNWVSSVGPFVDRFERVIADYVGAPQAVATASGTAALHMALLVAGVQPDDEVLVPTLAFIAPVNAIRYVGAQPVFIDAEDTYWQMDPAAVQAYLAHECTRQPGGVFSKHTGRRVRALLPVHLLGHPCDMAPLLGLAREYDLVVIEDAAEAVGAEYRGERVGRQSDIACFSFNGNKIVTAGGGGMVVTSRREWAQRARYLTTQAKDDPVESVHNAIGYNYRLTNVHAALGCAQMEYLDEHIDAKRRIARTYAEAFASLDGVQCMPEAPWARSTFWIYTILIDQAVTGVDRYALREALTMDRIESRPLWQPIHQSPAHATGTNRTCPVAERLHQQALSLPSSVGLQPAEQQRVIDCVRATMTGRQGAVV